MTMEPKEAVEHLMNDGIDFATEMLRKHGEFHSYGITLDANGEICNVAAYDGEEFPNGAEQLQLLEDGIRKKALADGDVAAAVFTNVGLRDDSGKSINAVQVGLEHLSGYAVNVFYPYTIENKEVSYGELIAMEREPCLF